MTTTSASTDSSAVDHRDPSCACARCSTRHAAPARAQGRLGCAVGARRGRRHAGDRLRHRRHPDGRRDGHRGLPARRRRDRHRGPRAGAGARASGTPAAPGWPRAWSPSTRVGQVFAAMVRASGRVPQISVVLGPAAGGAAYGPALTDIVIMSKAGRIFVTGPEVVRSVTGEQVDMERLGGPEPHGRRSGVVHITTKDDESALLEARKLAALLGRQGRLSPGRRRRRRRGGPRPGRGDARRGQPGVRREAGRQGPARRAGRGAARQVGAERGDHPGPVRRPYGRRHRQQPAAPGRLPRRVQRREGGPVRADVRRARACR